MIHRIFELATKLTADQTERVIPLPFLNGTTIILHRLAGHQELEQIRLDIEIIKTTSNGQTGEKQRKREIYQLDTESRIVHTTGKEELSIGGHAWKIVYQSRIVLPLPLTEDIRSDLTAYAEWLEKAIFQAAKLEIYSGVKSSG